MSDGGIGIADEGSGAGCVSGSRGTGFASSTSVVGTGGGDSAVSFSGGGGGGSCISSSSAGDEVVEVWGVSSARSVCSFVKAAPQLPQNFAPSGFSNPQYPQNGIVLNFYE